MSLDRLPLFPLPLVLFPGTSLRLHIFEPRYRRLLADCMGGDRRFGLIRLPEGTAEVEIASGTIGCIAEITSTNSLPDGRSNIAVHGTERFELMELVDSPAPYHVCRAIEYRDDPGVDAPLLALAGRVRDVFGHVGKAARALADDPEPLPELPDAPDLLSFAIASAIDLDLDTRQQLLSSDSPRERLERLDEVLTRALGTLGTRAQVHTIAKSNGRGTHLQP